MWHYPPMSLTGHWAWIPGITGSWLLHRRVIVRIGTTNNPGGLRTPDTTDAMVVMVVMVAISTTVATLPRVG